MIRIAILDDEKADLEKEEDFVNYCDRLVNEKIVHEEDADLFLEQTDLEALRSVLYHATAPEFYRYRENVSGQYIWVTTEGAALPGLLCPEPVGDCAGAQRRTGRPAQRGGWTSLTATIP